jgi:hypothetical protein
VYTNLDIRGCISIQANNVTIKNSRITGGCDPVVAIRPYDREVTGTVLDHVDIRSTGLGANAIAFRSFTMKFTHVATDGDCGRVDGNVNVTDSFCEILPGHHWTSTSDPHFDGWQSEPGPSNIHFNHNTVINPYGQTSAIALWTDGPNLSITNNLLIGGGWTLYCGAYHDVPPGRITITGNRFVPGQYGLAAHCEGATWSGNVDDRTGRTI